MNGTGAALLRAEHLIKSYAGRRVVNEVSIEVHAGEVVGPLGPNGAANIYPDHQTPRMTQYRRERQCHDICYQCPLHRQR